MMNIYWNANDLTEDELAVKLKALGYEFDADYIFCLPRGSKMQVGVMHNGRINEVNVYRLNDVLKFFEDISECDLTAKLHALGHNIKPGWEIHIPWVMDGPKYTYSVEQLIHFASLTTNHNIADKLQERGYTVTAAEKLKIHNLCSEFSLTYKNGYNCYNVDNVISYFSQINEDNLQEKLRENGYDLDYKTVRCIIDNPYLSDYNLTFDIDTVISYLNSVTEQSLPAMLKQRGYRIEANDFYRIKRIPNLANYDKGFLSYDLEKVIDYLNTLPPLEKIKRLYIPNPGTSRQFREKSHPLATPKLQNFYSGVVDFNNTFPIQKWYVHKYGVVPDAFWLGRLDTTEFLNDDKFILRWSNKGFLDYYDDTQEKQKVNRYLERWSGCEYIREALYEVEEGMYIFLFNGRFNYSEGTSTAYANLYYQEGLHDPTEMILYAFENAYITVRKGSLGLLYSNGLSLAVEEFDIPEPEIDFEKNYNKGFKEVHEAIFSALSKPHGKGLVLLHGAPGTGKTTYLRYLTNKINKNKIYIPPSFTNALSNPEIVPFLIDNPNSILFIEDAENVLCSREDGFANQAVSNILNLTDGIFSDCLNIQIVATFNTNIKNIDPALLRKGRLIERYDFKPLTPDRAEDLALSLGVWFDDFENLTLADIYAKSDSDNEDEEEEEDDFDFDLDIDEDEDEDL